MSNVKISLESGEQLDVRSFAVHEALSASFQIDVIAVGDDDVDLKKVSGRPASFGLVGPSGRRIWTGVCARIAQTEVESDGLSTYALRIVPVFWLLSHRRNHRVYKHASVPQIVKKVLDEWRLPFELRLDEDDYAKREFKVQYGENDHDFVRRLLVDAGISFFFTTPEGEKETKMILTDTPTTSEPREKALPFVRSASLAEKSEHITEVNIAHDVRPGRAVVRDFDFRRPTFPLAGAHSEGDDGPDSMLEEYFFLPGSSHAAGDSDGSTPIGDAEGNYRHNEKEAKRKAQRHVEAMRGAASRISFNTSATDVAPGTVFSMKGHPHRDLGNGKKLLVLSSFLSGEVDDDWHAGGEAVSADKPFRPLLTSISHGDAHRSGEDGAFKPLSKASKPRIHGVQSAVVVGPPGEDIHCDEHGRVRVQFPWDREAKGDEKGSCWVRVSQAWAGPGFGMVTLPRVGQEVLVAFLEGDPDLPVVVGRLFGTISPVPYSIPENKTRTTLKSSSKNGGNEITFDDKADGELFYLEATKDLHKVVQEDELEETKGNRHVTVEGDLILSAKGNVIIQAGKELVVKGGPKIQLNPPVEVPAARKPKKLGGHGPKKHAKHEPNEAKHEPPKHEPPKHEKEKEPPKHADDKEPQGKSKATKQNELLGKMNPGPAGKYHQIAAARKTKAEHSKELAKKIGERYDIPPALALAWMNRESAFGEFLDANGYSKFDGMGFGLFQVDKRYHTPKGGPSDWHHIDQAMDIYKGYIRQIKDKHPGWSEEEYLAAGLVAYNAGPSNAQTRPSSTAAWAQLDKGTAHDDYSRDVWAEAQWYSKHLKW
ncbi:MAG TPA: type VI secretion system tip protein TssI/VgrG [Polyangium sp.]|nr:type VI secretion system tip protein TssI/VgrG [Polyangium sp.]